MEPRVVLSPALQRLLHARRPEGGVPQPSPLPDRAALAAAQSGIWQKRRGRAVELAHDAATGPLLTRARALLDRDPGELAALDVEAARAALLGAPLAEPFAPVASAVVGLWVVVGGPQFAIEALLHGWRYSAFEGQSSGRFLVAAPGAEGDPDQLGAWWALRTLLASCDDATYQAARAAASRAAAAAVGPRASLARAALAYAFPSELAWAEAATDEIVEMPNSYAWRCRWHVWCLIAALRDPARVEALIQPGWRPRPAGGLVPSLLDGLGAAATPFLERLLDRYGTAAERKPVAEAFVAIESPRAAAFVATHLDDRQLGPLAPGYFARRPDLGIPALAERLATVPRDAPAAALLEALLTKHPRATGELGEAARAVVDRVLRRQQRAAAAEEASDVPAALVPVASRRPLPEFVDADVLPRLRLPGGAALPRTATLRLAQLLAASRPDRAAPGLDAARAACEPASLEDAAWALLEAWLRVGSPPAGKWALTSLPHLGGDETVRRLAPLLLQWPAQGASGRARVGLDVLARIGSDVAVTHLQRLASSAKSKPLRAHAEAAIDAAAAARGLSRDELEDRTVPSLGLGPDGMRELDFGPRRFRVGFDAQSRPCILDSSGQRLPRLPAAGKDDERALAEAAAQAWKSIRSDAELVLKAQVRRLERAMCLGRVWSRSSFRTLASHPLLQHLVRRLVWQGEHGCFRVAEDGSLADAADSPCEVAGDVRLPHPVLMDAADVAAFTRIFADYEIVQPFAQLARPWFARLDDERETVTLQRVAGQAATSNRLLGLKHRGWKVGYLEYGDERAVRPIEGTALAVHLQVRADLTLGGATLLDEEAEKHRFGELTAIAFSELVRDLEWLCGR